MRRIFRFGEPAIKIAITLVFLLCDFARGQTADPDTTAASKIYESLEEALQSPLKVQRLKFAGPIQELGAALPVLKELRWLKVFCDSLPVIPTTISHCQSLEVVALRGVKSIDIEQTLGILKTLPKLADLELTSFEVPRIPTSIKDLSALRHLRLRNLNLESLDSSICELRELETLELLSTRLSSLPQCIGDMKALKSLELDYNPQFARRLSKTICEIARLPNLESLGLVGWELDSIPNAITTLSSLRVLQLANNNIREIPEGLDKMVNLRVMNLRKNPLSKGDIDALRTKMPYCVILW